MRHLRDGYIIFCFRSLVLPYWMPIDYSAFHLYTNIVMYMFTVVYLSLHVSIYSPKYSFEA